MTDDITDDLDAPRPQRSGMHSLVWAMLFLVAVGGGSMVIRALYVGATVVVQADAAATAVLNTSAVTVHEIDGPRFFTLRPGTQTLPPARYRIQVDWDVTELNFSTGTEFTAERDRPLMIAVKGVVAASPPSSGS
jgi:hypothetical protein